MYSSNRVLELYSGIGGMHFAWSESSFNGNIVAAVDINTVANHVYQFNYPETPVMNRNIQSITADDINKLNVDVILMSPPCQPFTRNGNQKDISDKRNTSLNHFIDILQHLKTVRYVLLENVKGFEESISRDQLIDALVKSGFKFREFLLSPQQIGVPNSRLRYYCLARRTSDFDNVSHPEIVLSTKLPHTVSTEEVSISSILEKENMDDYSVPDKFYKRAQVFDICGPHSRSTCCFTKAYTHFIEGTGSVFTTAEEDDIKSTYSRAMEHGVESDEYKLILKSLNIRFFTPREVARLMSFPEKFNFPNDITQKQKYRLLGNSINVKVVSELIKVLMSDLNR